MTDKPLHEPALPGRPATSLVLLAGLTLFAELAFIRWASANVIYLGYFSNFVLMACFLGIGLGFLVARRERNLLGYVAPALAGVCLSIFVLQTNIGLSEDGIDGRVYFNTGEVLTSLAPPWLTLSILFVGIAGAFTCLSQATGRCFPHFEPIRAYTLDIAGSLLGIIAFTVMSFMWAPPWVWFCVVGAGLVLLTWSQSRQVRMATVAGALLAVSVVWMSDYEPQLEETVWSPYQKISAQIPSENHVLLRANGVPHQDMTSIDDIEFGRDVPYVIAKEAGVELQDVLIIGAGSGTDVAEALSRGLRVTAVEIDPSIQQFGARLHPDKPYDNPDVEVVINDGRAYMERTDKKFDMIILALPDSLALYSSFSSVRLESFLFTKEAMELAKSRLREGGLLAMYNDYRTMDVVAKLATHLQSTFGGPAVYRKAPQQGSRFQILVGGANLQTVRSDQTFEPYDEHMLPVDDWPFLYMAERRIPPIYWYLIFGILFVTLIAVVVLAPKGTLKTLQWPFFFMGAAFLLLETKSIIQFSLLFGTTWLVNSLVFAGVLVMVLLANLLVARFKIRTMWPWYILLAIVLLANYLIPVSSLGGLDLTLRYTAACALLLTPIFVANIIFSGTFASSTESDTSFGWNILGTMVGGTVENFSLVLGYHKLALVVAVFYALAFITDRLRRSRSSS